MSFLRGTSLVLIALFLAIPLTADAQVWVDGYYRDDGTYVEGHYRSSPDGNPYNNYSFPGNFNPNTGEISSGSEEVYLRNYYDSDSETSEPVSVDSYLRDDESYVEGDWRTAPSTERTTSSSNGEKNTGSTKYTRNSGDIDVQRYSQENLNEERHAVTWMETALWEMSIEKNLIKWIRRGESLRVIESKGSHYKVEYEGDTGYVKEENLRPEYRE